MLKSQKSKSILGFTFIELLVAATILGVLSVIGLVSFRSANLKARNGKRQADLEQTRAALELYRVDSANRRYPNSGNWNNMISSISSYLTSTPTDPRAAQGYTYKYNTPDGGRTYTICATTEPNPPNTDDYCLINP